jgi:uncharacterized repeat protein (TIGR02543 family)
MNNQVVIVDTQSVINENLFTKIGYIFAGWNTKGDGSGQSYNDGDNITLNEDMTLYAVWSPINYTITFNANGGSGSMASIDAVYDQNYSLSNHTFTRSNYHFIGWNTKNDGSGQSYTEGQTVKNLTTVNNDEIILYAMWEQDVTYSINAYDVDESKKYISKIMANTELNAFKANFVLGYGYKVDVDTKLVNKKSILYTGGKTKIIYESNIYKEYTNIVIGDINGDGVINSADLLKIRQHLLKVTTLNGVYYISSDINYDNLINSADLLRVRQHLLGTKPII